MDYHCIIHKERGLLIEKLASGEGRPSKVSDKINEIIDEVNILMEDYNPSEARQDNKEGAGTNDSNAE